jgi:hypothetical protein
MSLRSVEVCRLMLNEIKYGNSPHIDVRGKGRGSGKYKSVSFHSQTPEVFEAWLKEKEKQLQEFVHMTPIGWILETF